MNKQIPADIADDELSALVAKEHGWYWDQHEYTTRNLINYWPGMWRRKDSDECGDLPKYATSADCVLPLMEVNPKGWGCYRKTANRDYEIAIYGAEVFRATASAFPRACCLALLASKGFTITPATAKEGAK